MSAGSMQAGALQFMVVREPVSTCLAADPGQTWNEVRGRTAFKASQGHRRGRHQSMPRQSSSARHDMNLARPQPSRFSSVSAHHRVRYLCSAFVPSTVHEIRLVEWAASDINMPAKHCVVMLQAHVCMCRAALGLL